MSKTAWSRYVAPELEADLGAAQVAKLAHERWEVYHLVINQHSAHLQGSVGALHQASGRRFTSSCCEDPAAAAETIRAGNRLAEGSIDLDEGLSDLVEIGSRASREVVGKALARVGSSGGGGG